MTDESESWMAVDRASDPRAFAVYLEQVSALDAFHEYKQRSLPLLEPAR